MGTTYSCVAVYRNDVAEVIANDQGHRITPSYVSWDDEGFLIVGDAAKFQALVHPEKTLFDVKRIIGRSFDDPIVQEEKRKLPFNIVNQNGRVVIEVNLNRKIRYFAPEEISA